MFLVIALDGEGEDCRVSAMVEINEPHCSTSHSLTLTADKIINYEEAF